MTGPDGVRATAANPFERLVETPWGPLSVVVVGRDEARVTTPWPVRFRSLLVTAKGSLSRASGEWVLVEFEASARAGGRTFASCVGHERADVFREAILDASVHHLSANERLLVEADLVSVYRARRTLVAEVVAVRAEIERRLLKMEALAARNEVEFEALNAREAAIRAELDALSGTSKARLASGATQVDHDVGAP